MISEPSLTRSSHLPSNTDVWPWGARNQFHLLHRSLEKNILQIQQIFLLKNNQFIWLFSRSELFSWLYNISMIISLYSLFTNVTPTLAFSFVEYSEILIIHRHEYASLQLRVVQLFRLVSSLHLLHHSDISDCRGTGQSTALQLQVSYFGSLAAVTSYLLGINSLSLFHTFSDQLD